MQFFVQYTLKEHTTYGSYVGKTWVLVGWSWWMWTDRVACRDRRARLNLQTSIYLRYFFFKLTLTPLPVIQIKNTESVEERSTENTLVYTRTPSLTRRTTFSPRRAKRNVCVVCASVTWPTPLLFCLLIHYNFAVGFSFCIFTVFRETKAGIVQGIVHCPCHCPLN